MKKVFKYTLPALMLCLMASCSDKDSVAGTDTHDPLDPNAGKEVIAFTQEGNAMTRAALTRAGFSKNTKIVVRIKAEGKSSSDIRYTQAIMTAGAQTTTDDDCNTQYGLIGTHSHLSYDDGQTRFWDDAFGRDSKLTVYAVAVPDNAAIADNLETTDVNEAKAAKLANNILDQTVNTQVNTDWYTISGDESTTIGWQVSAVQSSTTRAVEDLAYSNNIKAEETVNKGRYYQKWTENTSTTPSTFYWKKGMDVGRMVWEPQETGSTTGKFDQGHLVFKHALSWITIVLQEQLNTATDDYGFDNNSNSDFQWTKDNASATQNITLVGFPTSGTLDVSNGNWSGKVENVDITQMDEETKTETTANRTVRTLHAYVLPGTTLANNSNDVIKFEIDRAQYYVKGSQIADAIKEYYKEGGTHATDPHADEYRNFTATQAGKNYIINLTIAKKGISNITAAILDWETVNSTDAAADNAHCTFTFEDRAERVGTGGENKFNLYRAANDAGAYITDEYNLTNEDYNWKTGYTNADGTTPNMATKTWHADSDASDSKDDSHWSTNWFFENNRTNYHFRAAGLGDSGSSSENTVKINKDATNGDYFEITHGTTTSSTYKDFVWGAPFTFVDNTYEIKYDNKGDSPNGFAKKADGTTYQISNAIGATNSQINMLLFHMTCQIFVNVQTTRDDNKVVLENSSASTDDGKYTKVEILNFLPNGKVLMGNGLVSAVTTDTRVNGTMNRGTFSAQSGSGTTDDPYRPDRVENYSYGMVPQSLSYGTGTGAGTIGLRITTPDGNQYLVNDLSTCTGSVTTKNLINPYTGTAGAYVINEWYPHYQYTYTLTIQKKGITNITAAVLPWEEVHAEITTPITLEN